MSVWPEQYKPVLFDDLHPQNKSSTLSSISLQANPPTFFFRSNRLRKDRCASTGLSVSTRPVVASHHPMHLSPDGQNVRAMAKFGFLRPEGAGSEDTAGRTSLDAFDHNISASSMHLPPAGEESAPPEAGTLAAVSRIIIIEDADYSVTLDNLTCAE